MKRPLILSAGITLGDVIVRSCWSCGVDRIDATSGCCSSCGAQCVTPAVVVPAPGLPLVGHRRRSASSASERLSEKALAELVARRRSSGRDSGIPQLEVGRADVVFYRQPFRRASIEVSENVLDQIDAISRAENDGRIDLVEVGGYLFSHRGEDEIRHVVGAYSNSRPGSMTMEGSDSVTRDPSLVLRGSWHTHPADADVTVSEPSDADIAHFARMAAELGRPAIGIIAAESYPMPFSIRGFVARSRSGEGPRWAVEPVEIELRQ